MSEKLLELSSVVNVLSRTVADLEKQRQTHDTRSSVMGALVLSILNTLPKDQRAQIAENFQAASATLLRASTASGRAATQREIVELQKLFGN